MDLDVIEDCLQRAAELSTVWAVVREQDAGVWIVVLEDESLLDVEYDANSGHLMVRTELGQVMQAETRAVFNDLLVRCASVFDLPRIGMSSDHRYELLASWTVEPAQSGELAALFNDVTTQARAWRAILTRPLNLDETAPIPSPAVDLLTLKA